MCKTPVDDMIKNIMDEDPKIGDYRRLEFKFYLYRSPQGCSPALKERVVDWTRSVDAGEVRHRSGVYRRCRYRSFLSFFLLDLNQNINIPHTEFISLHIQASPPP